MAETDEQLLARWRETLTTVRGFDGQELDPVDRQTLNELQRQLERAEAELDRRGLRRTGLNRDGSWQPLSMHEAAPQGTTPEVELTWEPREELVGNPLLEMLADPSFDRADWDKCSSVGPRLVDEVPMLVREWERERERELSVVADSEPITHRREPAFVPELVDGLTADQRLIIERLGHGPLPQEQLLAEAPDSASLARALEQLRLPRRYPLISEQRGMIELTALAKCMISLEPGRVRVHGGFFPNLLANGAADALAFPEYEVARIIGAASLLMEHPETPSQGVAHALGLPRKRDRPRLHRWSRSERDDTICVETEMRQWTVSKRLEFHFLTTGDAERAAERLRLAEERQEFDEGTQHALSDGRTLVVTLPPGVEGIAVMRRLWRDRALESWWRLDTTCLHDGEARPRTPREMVEVFVRRSREEVLRRLRREKLPADNRLEIIEGLMRVAADERLAALVDAAETKDDAVWALTHLDSVELTAHPRLGRHAVRGEPFSERQARAIVSTNGLHRRLHLLTLERESLLEELSSRLSPFRPSEIDRLVHEQFAKVRTLAHDLDVASCRLD